MLAGAPFRLVAGNRDFAHIAALALAIEGQVEGRLNHIGLGEGVRCVAGCDDLSVVDLGCRLQPVLCCADALLPGALVGGMAE